MQEQTRMPQKYKNAVKVTLYLTVMVLYIVLGVENQHMGDIVDAWFMGIAGYSFLWMLANQYSELKHTDAIVYDRKFVYGFTVLILIELMISGFLHHPW